MNAMIFFVGATLCVIILILAFALMSALGSPPSKPIEYPNKRAGLRTRSTDGEAA